MKNWPFTCSKSRDLNAKLMGYNLNNTEIGGEPEWRRENTGFPPMWPGFKSWRWCHMWIEFVVGFLLCSERFFSGYSGFPLSLKTNTSKFQFDLERTDTFQWVLMNSWVLREWTNYTYNLQLDGKNMKNITRKRVLGRLTQDEDSLGFGSSVIWKNLLECKACGSASLIWKWFVIFMPRNKKGLALSLV